MQKVWLVQTIALSILVGCSDPYAGGNSAESGNPEVAGILELPNGKPASNALIQCVPVDFALWLGDSLDTNHVTQTDTNGYFQLSHLHSGFCALEAYHAQSGTRLLIMDLPIVQDSTYTIHDSLQQTGTLRLGLKGYNEGDSGWVMVPGTSIMRPVSVKFASVYADSLPVAQLDSILFIALSGEVIVLDTHLNVTANDTLTYHANPIHFEITQSLNTSASGADLQDTLRNFPLAWRLDSNDIDFSIISPHSGSLRIQKDQSSLGFQIASWNATTQQAVIWVRIDTLFPQSSRQSLRLTWDEGDSTPTTVLPHPFDSSNYFAAAWHFEEDSILRDAGQYKRDGLAYDVTSEPGILGQGLYFNGTSSYITIPESESSELNFNFYDDATFSIWVRLDQANTSRFIFSKGPYQYYLKYYYPEGWLFENNDHEENSYRYLFIAPFDSLKDLGVWQHLAVVMHTNGKTALFVNGVLADTLASKGPSVSQRDTNNPFEIGRTLSSPNHQHFLGVMDELIINHGYHSDTWIYMLWLNQHPDNKWP